VPVIAAAALGAVFPDFDLIRFYLFDNHQRHHHDYWTHIPAIWGLIALGWWALMKAFNRRFGTLPLVFIAAVFSHLVLDTMAGEIEWAWPFFSHGFTLVTVPATHVKWYLSFLTHWTFALEIFVSITALCVALSGNGYKDTKDAGAVASETEAGGGA
jgi:hypothetical protein